MIDYKIIVGDNQKEIEPQIREHIKLGWQPFGSLGVTELDYAQAMVKYEEKK